jgi:transposase
MPFGSAPFSVTAACGILREYWSEKRLVDTSEGIQESLGVLTKELRGVVQGLLKDEAAVRAGLALIWSNGPTEGFIHLLTLIKWQAYGRAGVDFLRHRLPLSAGMAA